jgi:ubiquitin carboxyl-terminal hydrolase 5/13
LTLFTDLLKVLRSPSSSSTPSSQRPDPTDIFRFGLEQRLQCTDCKGVRYRVDSQDTLSVPVDAVEKGKDEDGKMLYESVRLTDCVKKAMGVEATEGYECPRCEKKVTAVKCVLCFSLPCLLKRLRNGCADEDWVESTIRNANFSTFPDVLVVHMKKFQLVNWVPQKLGLLSFPVAS